MITSSQKPMVPVDGNGNRTTYVSELWRYKTPGARLNQPDGSIIVFYEGDAGFPVTPQE